MRGPGSGGIYPSDIPPYPMMTDCMRHGWGDEFLPSRLGNCRAAKSNYTGYHFPIKKTESPQSVTNSRSVARAPRDEWWRVEIRLGKKHLREVHKFVQFRDIGVRAVGLFRRAVTSVRYLADGNLALNVSRHPTHPFWIGVQRAVIQSLETERWL